MAVSIKKVNEDINNFVAEVVNQFQPERVILYGSHASGNSDVDSDVDILVEMNFEGRGYQKAFEIRKNIKRSFPLDIIVRRPADVASRIDKDDFFFREIMETGKVLYERTG